MYVFYLRYNESCSILLHKLKYFFMEKLIKIILYLKFSNDWVCLNHLVTKLLVFIKKQSYRYLFINNYKIKHLFQAIFCFIIVHNNYLTVVYSHFNFNKCFYYLVGI